MTGHRLLASCLVGAPVAMLVEPVVVARVVGDYSVRDQAISDLGVTECGATVPGVAGEHVVCSPAWLLLDAGMVLTGLFLVAAGVLLRATPLARGWTVALLLVAGVSTIGAGLVPLDVSAVGHTLLALPAFPAQAVALLLMAAPLGRWCGPGWSVGLRLSGSVALLASLAFAAPTGWGVPFGIVERVAAYLPLVALAAVGVRLLVDARRYAAA